MHTKKTKPISEQDIQKTTEKYLSALKAQNMGSFLLKKYYNMSQKYDEWYMAI
jgi:hypothetical protein